MKKLFLATMLFVAISSTGQGSSAWKGNSDVNLPSTTEKEYNYLTKGLKAQKENGLDAIAGYDFKDEDRILVDNKYMFTFSNLVEKSTNSLKGISVVIKSGVTKSTYYLCIPVNNDLFTSKYEQFIDTFTIDLAKAYAKALSKKQLKNSSENHK